MKKNINDLIEKLDSIKVGISATHLNYVNGNNLYYTLDAIKNGGGETWVTPYKKPQLLHHDKHRDAVGRIDGYEIKDTPTMENEPKDFVELSVEITDEDAIANVIKGIYLTCSVGSSTNKVRCSICNQSLTTDGLCEHEKGQMYDGKKAYWIIDAIEYKENSFVNNPADPFSRITSIDLGDGSMAYETFLSDKEDILTDFFMEDDMTKKGKLSADDRAKLADSVFCGPSKSFPAHDEAHVKAGLKLLDTMEDIDDAIKNKIKGALYRKGKRFDILTDDAEVLAFRMDDEFTEDETKIIVSFFDENKDADLPSDEETTDDEETTEDETKVEFSIDDYETIIKGKKDEIISYCDFLVSEVKTLTDAIESLKEKETLLSDEITKQSTILISKEDEINKLLDDNATATVGYKKAIINNILDYKHIVDNRDEEITKFTSRKIDSLVDTLSDYRNDTATSIPKVNNETLTDSTDADNSEEVETTIVNTDESHEESRIDRFFKHNKMED